MDRFTVIFSSKSCRLLNAGWIGISAWKMICCNICVTFRTDMHLTELCSATCLDLMPLPGLSWFHIWHLCEAQKNGNNLYGIPAFTVFHHSKLTSHERHIFTKQTIITLYFIMGEIYLHHMLSILYENKHENACCQNKMPFKHYLFTCLSVEIKAMDLSCLHTFFCLLQTGTKIITY